MHACLNSLSTGVPAIPMAYSDKFKPLLNDLGWSYTADLRDGGDVAREVLLMAASPQLASDAQLVRARADEQVAASRVALQAAVPAISGV